ncbi:cellular tumor antigen p53 [Galendromus occidentalis]|uniref:Cellular tumor antigen p53 n=1 Tax=Galendromus occidentalis TaxID=34638 RepID=A0AAJ6VW98_9ACAR|nr:cellular tumor antigen p53 [Galendromus occidentalis]
MEDVPNSQDIVDLMLNFNEDVQQVISEQEIEADSTVPAPSYFPTELVQRTSEDLIERDLHTFAEDFLLGPAVQQQYQDIKPVVNPHELFLSQINSTVVNQSLRNAPGDLGFKVTFDQHDKVTKNMTWTYSNEVGRLYVMLNSQCPFKISTTSPPPDNSYIVCIPAYKDAVSRRENVVRCPHHCRNQDMNGLSGKFWMNSTHSQSIYYEDIQNNRRHCLIVPYEKPHAGCSTYTYILEFMCRNTCVGGVNRRATEVVFLLQHEGRELGRCVVEVKVCACPGRDRRHDETTLVKRLSMETAKGKAKHSGSAGHTKAVKLSQETNLNLSNAEEHDTASEEQWYTIRVKGKSNFEILKRVAEGLELRSAQKLKKRKLTDSRNQNQPTDVKREVDIVYSDG